MQEERRFVLVLLAAADQLLGQPELLLLSLVTGLEPLLLADPTLRL